MIATVQVQETGMKPASEAASKPMALLLTTDGSLLYAENSGPTGATLVPSAASARGKKLEAILKALRAR